MIKSLYFFAISFVISLLIGIERERSHTEGAQAIGLRTFVLFGLLGTLANSVNNIALTISLSLFVFTAILLGYLRSTSKRIKHADIGLTTEISAAAVFCLGFIIPQSPLLGVILGSLILLLLLERKRLHILAREKLRFEEIEAFVALVIFAVGILPFLPNHPIDPWQLFNPKLFGILITVIAAMQFSGYVAIRLFGHRLGMALVGFFGGLVSSTAVFATLPTIYHEHPALLRSLIAAAIFSVVGMLIELLFILLIASKILLLSMIWPILSMTVLGSIFGILLSFRQKRPIRKIQPKNPLDFLSILKLTLFIGSTLILVSLAKRYLGTGAAQIVAFLGGLFELHSVSLTTASLYLTHKLKLTEAQTILSIATLASFISKFFILWSLARNRFAFWTSLLLLILLIAGSLVFWMQA